MANEFDRIFKETIGHIFLFLSEKYFGFEAVEWQVLSPNLPGTYEREVDYLYEVRSETGDHFLLHIEFQTRDDTQMLGRMGVYHALLYDRYGLPVRHKVIYLGAEPSRMQCRLEERDQYTGFDLISIRDRSMVELAGSELPWEVVLAVLGDFGEVTAEAGIELIVQRLLDLPLSDTDRKKSLVQLKILSRLRKLDGRLLTTLEKMPIEFDFNVKEDAFYQAGKEEGVEEGLQSERLASAARFVRLGVPIEQVAEVQQLSVAEIEAFMASVADSE